MFKRAQLFFKNKNENTPSISDVPATNTINAENRAGFAKAFLDDFKNKGSDYCETKYSEQLIADMKLYAQQERAARRVDAQDHPRTETKYLQATELANLQREEGIFLLKNKKEVKQIIQYAKQHHAVVRTCGSQHSVPNAIFDDEPNSIYLKLVGELQAIGSIKPVDETLAYVTVGAGCYLGINPSDPHSNKKNSLTRCIDAKGYALPILGGISHQTVAGFLQTGSAGGSTSHGYAGAIEEIHFIDGNAKEVILRKGTDEFNAAGVSLGLFGVIVAVKFNLCAKYLVKGTEKTLEFADSYLKNADDLPEKLAKEEYTHAVWFAQQGVNRVLQFEGANEVYADDKIVPYKHLLQNEKYEMIMVRTLYITNILCVSDSELAHALMALLLKIIIKDDPSIPSDFCDKWFIALPADDQVHVDSLLDTAFTEIWIPIQQAPEVIARLTALFTNDLCAAGNFGVEIYPAKESNFWLSPAYGYNVIRVDPYWWKGNPCGKAEDYFKKFWDTLLSIEGARLHWGKYLPLPTDTHGGVHYDSDHLALIYPKFNDWLALRHAFDPNQVFLTSYWRNLLNIPLPKRLEIEDSNSNERSALQAHSHFKTLRSKDEEQVNDHQNDETLTT